jgi:FdrA protein
MSVILNAVRRATYLDSIVLMRVSRRVAALPGVEEAGLFIGTPANKEILREAGILGQDGEAAAPGDLILALRARDEACAQAALAEANRLIDQPMHAGSSVMPGAAGAIKARSIRAAVRQLPDANLALISVPGDFAAAEARNAMALGLHAMIFSDNVPIAEEVALKREARERGLLVMGPDCGTAVIGGTPVAFANEVPRGDIGIIGASGTGIQEVSCLIARAGGGISHALGTGGRDLSPEVGAVTTLMALDALDADTATRHIVLISKPPAADIARIVLERVAKSRKPFTICFLGAPQLALPPHARRAVTLTDAAELALGQALPRGNETAPVLQRGRGALVRGLFAGGTLCAEAQVVFRDAGLMVASNVPVPGAVAVAGDTHAMIDLGDDRFTRGRPHPMIEPAVRDRPLAEALADRSVGVVLLDVVLGYGAHPDPAGALTAALARASAGERARPLLIASVTGTDADPQPRVDQVRRLEAAGVTVAGSNAQAAALAVAALALPARRREAGP